MLNRGKICVLAILVVALTLSGLAWMWNRFAGMQSLKFWGPDGALIIRDGEQVELFEVIPPGPEESALFSNVTFPSPSGIRFTRELTNPRDVSGAPGMIHAKNSLLQDHSFRWASGDQQHALRPEATRCTHAVRFTKDGEGAVTILFDFRENRLYFVEGQKSVLLAPKTVSGWKTYIRRFVAVDKTRAQKSPPKASPDELEK